ncbi:MAG: glycosyltransferase family 1 protein [Anaerovibrio sp.]|nr:glycosyltransferase family 1 protein [Anaerovibrio sp.]
MRIGIFENIMTPGGHEVEFDRILVEELQKRGHEVSFYVPQDFQFSFDYKVPTVRLGGDTVSYTKVSGLTKLLYSVKREYNRQKWYAQLYEAAYRRDIDALIVPTSTYRYLRALNKNILRRSSVPIIFVLHGINPKEAPKFLKEAKKLLPFKNIRMVVLTFVNHIFGHQLPNVYPIYPPAYVARDIEFTPAVAEKDVLTVGFFGQYRREKRLRDFLEVYVKGHYTRRVRLLVQGATMHPEDSEDFEQIISEYRDCQDIEFLHKGLIGAEWQQAIADIDVLLMPYSAPRYLYHWGGMLFTAIGFHKPVIASDDINPEVFAKFNIGMTFKSGDMADLQQVMEKFINGYAENFGGYAEGLREAAEKFSPESFAHRVEAILTGEYHTGKGK